MFLHKPFNQAIAHKTVGISTNIYSTPAGVTDADLQRAATRAENATVEHDNEEN